MKKQNIFIALILCCAVLCFTFSARADFGSFSGDTDYSSGGFDSGSDYDFDFDSDSDYDYSSDYIYDGEYSDSDGDWIIAIIIAGIVVAVWWFSNKTPKKTTVRIQRPQRPKGEPLSTYLEKDPGFDATAFNQKMSNLYVQMQNCWTAKDIEPLRPYFTDAFFNQMLHQLDGLTKSGCTNYVERIAVLGVVPECWYSADDLDHIIVTLNTRIVDYTVKDATGEVVSGNKQKEKFMTYEWELVRKSGVLTADNSGLQTVTCPSCGAFVDINASAKCPYCDRVLNVENEDWAICRIDGISQRTA